VANDSKKSPEKDSGEFAEFMADISQEIAQRVESLDAQPKPPAQVKKKTPTPPDTGIIVEWPNIIDRMIEEVR
jgi:hypothetical protein